VIALAIRPWRLNAAVTALRAAFPGAKVHIRHYDPRAGFADFAVSQAITVTDARELLTMTTSWGSRRLRVTAEVLNACEHEAAIAALIATAVPKMERGAVVELGIPGAEPKQPETSPEVAPKTAETLPAAPEKPHGRGPRLGRRVDPEELRQRLRGVVIR